MNCLCENQYTGILEDILKELDRASKWPLYNSAHEAYGVLKEEVDEFWDEVKINQKNRDLEKMRAELIQVAAVAIRSIQSVCSEEKIRK